jgi:ubiquitin-protein ligase
MIKIGKDNVKRLLNDVKDIILHPLHDNGIYYVHDDEDMLKGYAMIIGPEETPYFGGFYFFEFFYPSNYPYSPPSLKYKTNINNIRFNPNLYTNEKVCVSILNTWNGEQWSSCQSLRTILLTLVTLLNKEPLLNEPGINFTNKEINSYNKIIEYANIKYACCDIVLKSKNIYLEMFSIFENEIVKLFINNHSTIRNIILEKIKEQKSKKINTCLNKDDINNNSFTEICQVYRISAKINYNELLEKLDNTLIYINNKNELKLN